ncbi:hypothetical protein GW17_00048680 [Ensete ventricosum]|nr:hypothetical protein GW17_00048680 [Ensete ventricosum]
MITWDHGIAIHHGPITTADTGPQEQDVPTIGPRGTLVRNYRSRPRDMKLSLKDKADLKMQLCPSLAAPINYSKCLRRSATLTRGSATSSSCNHIR